MDELVDHHLRAVGEVAELRFPDHQRVRLGAREPVFESEHGFLGEHRIDHQEASLVAAEVLQRHVSSLVPALAVLVVQHRVTVRERATSHILPRESHVVAVGE